MDEAVVRTPGLIFVAVFLSGCASAPPPKVAVGSVPTTSTVPASPRSPVETRSRRDPPAKSSPAQARELDAAAQRCIALVMYWEARGEGRKGMLAVGSVVLNRVDDQRFPDTVCGVVYQGGETPPCQFSWWCDGKSDRPTQQAAWNKSLALARDLLVNRPRDPTEGALFFHNTSIDTPWRRERTARIGGHIFYR